VGCDCFFGKLIHNFLKKEFFAFSVNLNKISLHYLEETIVVSTVKLTHKQSINYSLQYGKTKKQINKKNQRYLNIPLDFFEWLIFQHTSILNYVYFFHEQYYGF